ncbi:hypothetical protein [Enterococcus sp. DIV0800]|uniref:hypothetical protein n=1 Tax=unclassified Enterococcus TaxID=2608891 RepID=UPI003D300A62
MTKTRKDVYRILQEEHGTFGIPMFHGNLDEPISDDLHDQIIKSMVSLFNDLDKDGIDEEYQTILNDLEDGE